MKRYIYDTISYISSIHYSAKMTINLSKLILKGIEYHHPEFYSITGIVSPNQKSLL